MIIAFELKMPHCGSWNGRWSGEENLHVITKSNVQGYSSKWLKSFDGKDYVYNWGDGWCACISCRKVSSREAASLRKRSSGFCGYDWMVDSILTWGEILTDREVKERLAVK